MIRCKIMDYLIQYEDLKAYYMPWSVNCNVQLHKYGVHNIFKVSYETLVSYIFSIWYMHTITNLQAKHTDGCILCLSFNYITTKPVFLY
jgi:UDP-galactopyranose mutase